MYALSFIEAFRTVDSAVERALSLDTYRRTNRVRQIRSEAVAAVDDIAELAPLDGDGETLTFSARFACPHCGYSIPALDPRETEGESVNSGRPTTPSPDPVGPR